MLHEISIISGFKGCVHHKKNIGGEQTEIDVVRIILKRN